MKKLIVSVVALVVLTGSHAMARPYRAVGVKFGLIGAGQSFKYLQVPDLNAFKDKRYGFVAGFFVEWLDTRTVSLVTELDYVQRGSRDSFKATAEGSPVVIGETHVTMKDDYLSVPILLKVRLDMARASFYGLAGPRLDFLTSSVITPAEAAKPDLSSIDWGVTVGAGVELTNLLFYSLGLEARYSPGLKKVHATPLLEIKNSSMELLLVVGF